MSRLEADTEAGRRGVDGETEEQVDVAEVDRQKATEAMLRERSYLGREFLTWLLWRSRSTAALTTYEDQDLSVLVVGQVILRGIAGEATELAVKGHLSAYSEVVRQAIARGLLVHVARLRLLYGEQAFEVTLDAESLAFRSCSLPALLKNEDQDKLEERLFLMDRLVSLVNTMWTSFITIRTSDNWTKKEVAGMFKWLNDPPES